MVIKFLSSLQVLSKKPTEMVDATSNTLSAIQTVQAALTVLQSMTLTAYNFPPNCTLTNGTNYDFIIVGGGTAGCVLAYRLSENSNNTVLLIEAGGYPPLESELPGLFTVLPRSSYDYDFYSVNDNYTGQNLQDSCVGLTQGKMLGGSGGLHHHIYTQGDANDYAQWVNILGDDGWSDPNVTIYYKKFEKLMDSDLLNSSYVDLHGTDGMIQISRQTSTTNKKYLEAFKELGHNIVDDTTSTTSSLGYTEPLFSIGDGVRQSSALAYLSAAKTRSNLCLALSTTATKIIIENSIAVGVQVTTSSNDTYMLYANNEVLVSAGAINSPKLLMLSGIGPQEQLESLGIEVVADLPVGQNFMDHTSAVLAYQMEASTATAAATNPHMFPVDTTVGYVALDSSQSYPDYQVINLVFPHDSSAMMQLCANVFKYSNDICNTFSEANIGRSMLFVVHNLMMPKSCGKVMLASADPTDAPIVYTGTYSNSSDLTLMAKSLADFNQVLNTTYFTSANATLVDIGLCTGLQDEEYWECYALAMSATMWHYAGTCAMGSVTDSSMNVKGVNNLRVVDASSMVQQISGNINAVVILMAERAADLILSACST